MTKHEIIKELGELQSKFLFLINEVERAEETEDEGYRGWLIGLEAKLRPLEYKLDETIWEHLDEGE